MQVVDKLNRSDFIKFVEDLIKSSDQYKRDGDSCSYTIALDSPWGTGKSHFIDLLIQDIEKTDKIHAIKYNAWQNDYCDNAFDPLMYDILRSECFEQIISEKADEENIKNILTNILNIGLAFAQNLAVDFVQKKAGVDVGKALEEAKSKGQSIKDFMLTSIPNLEQLNVNREAFENIKMYLTEATEYMSENGEKIVVIIDELDRCKPTFAIQTLEIVKHIFDIKNMVFLFAIDIKQLSHSISCVYGQNFDSVGYLSRFFEYIAKMPAPDVSNYIKDKLGEMSLIPQIKVDSLKGNYRQCDFVDLIAEFFLQVYNSFEFSLRDLDTILQTYKIMLKNFLSDYQMVGAHMIYIFFISLKYKKPASFYKTFIDTAGCVNYAQTELRNFVDNNHGNVWIRDAVNVLEQGEALEKMDFLPRCDEVGVTSMRLSVRIEQVNDETVVVSYPSRDGFGRNNNIVQLSSHFSMGNVLFAPDLQKWDEIKKQKYREYLHRQLEMYNFVTLPEDTEVIPNDKL